MAGITTTGFDIRTVDQIIADFETKELQLISPSLDVQPTSLIGVLNGIMGQEFEDLWALGLALYNGMDPDGAADDQLTSLSLITGTRRKAATPTQVVGVQVTTSAGFGGAAIGAMVASVNGDPTALFANKTAVTSGAHAPATVDFQALDTGPIQCLAGTLTVIAQPLSGWTAVTNPNDGVSGDDVESNAALRLRRNTELSAPGASTADAIRADVLEQLTTTLSCTVLFNDGDTTDANGLPPHSIEVIAYLPGATSNDDADLAALIFADKAAGINTYGTSLHSVSDSQGNTQVVYFSRPTSVNIYVELSISVDGLTYAGDAAVKQAIVDYATAKIFPGGTIYAQAVRAAVFPSPFDPAIGVVGVKDVSVFKVDTVTPAVNTGNLSFAYTQIPVFSTARITVTIV